MIANYDKNSEWKLYDQILRGQIGKSPFDNLRMVINRIFYSKKHKTGKNIKMVLVELPKPFVSNVVG